MNGPLLLRFRVLLSLDFDDAHELHGPVFHRWLPDSDSHALEIPTGEPGVVLRLWFERCGFMEHGVIRFAYNRREVDADVMLRQTPLYGGPLRGLFRFIEVPHGVLDAVRHNNSGDAAYRSFGKHLMCDLLHPSVGKLIATLRTNYGQFWLPEFEAWDSRTRSLGAYCRELGLMWSEDEGATWTNFIPDEPQYTFHEPPLTGREYLDEASWHELGEFMRSGYAPSTAAVLIGRGHEVLEGGDLRYAVIEATTALEVALSDALRSPNTPPTVVEKARPFGNLSLVAQLATASALLGSFDEEQMRLAFKAIDLRHRVVHQGETPNEEAIPEIRALLKVAARFVSGPKFRFPNIPSGATVWGGVSPTE